MISTEKIKSSIVFHFVGLPLCEQVGWSLGEGSLGAMSLGDSFWPV
jgi:hypothetical protein